MIRHEGYDDLPELHDLFATALADEPPSVVTAQSVLAEVHAQSARRAGGPTRLQQDAGRGVRHHRFTDWLQGAGWKWGGAVVGVAALVGAVFVVGPLVSGTSSVSGANGGADYAADSALSQPEDVPAASDGDAVGDAESGSGVDDTPPADMSDGDTSADDGTDEGAADGEQRNPVEGTADHQPEAEGPRGGPGGPYDPVLAGCDSVEVPDLVGAPAYPSVPDMLEATMTLVPGPVTTCIPDPVWGSTYVDGADGSRVTVTYSQAVGLLPDRHVQQLSDNEGARVIGRDGDWFAAVEVNAEALQRWDLSEWDKLVRNLLALRDEVG